MCTCHTYRVGPADGVGDVAAQCPQPAALFNRLLSGQLEAEQLILLRGRGADHQREGVDTLWRCGGWGGEGGWGAAKRKR